MRWTMMQIILSATKPLSQRRKNLEYTWKMREHLNRNTFTIAENASPTVTTSDDHTFHRSCTWDSEKQEHSGWRRRGSTDGDGDLVQLCSDCRCCFGLNTRFTNALNHVINMKLGQAWGSRRPFDIYCLNNSERWCICFLVIHLPRLSGWLFTGNTIESKGKMLTTYYTLEWIMPCVFEGWLMCWSRIIRGTIQKTRTTLATTETFWIFQYADI